MIDENGYTLNNRDIATTELWINDSLEVVSVCPWELVVNAIENAGLSEANEKAAVETITQLFARVERQMEERA